MIEAGLCGGMELAWNLKRGGPEKSIDYLAYRKAGRWIGRRHRRRLRRHEHPANPAVGRELRRHDGDAGDLLAYPSCK